MPVTLFTCIWFPSDVYLGLFKACYMATVSNCVADRKATSRCFVSRSIQFGDGLFSPQHLPNIYSFSYLYIDDCIKFPMNGCSVKR